MTTTMIISIWGWGKTNHNTGKLGKWGWGVFAISLLLGIQRFFVVYIIMNEKNTQGF